MPSKSKLLLIAWEAAEWSIIEPLLDAGELLNLNRLIEHGVMSRLANRGPVEPPLAWTSVATGKRPEDHGIVGSLEPDENGIDVRPFPVTSRRCKAVWNLLNDIGLRTHVVAWPVTWPAEKLNGVMLSSGWDAPLVDPGLRSWFDLDAVSPPEFTETATELRMHQHELRLNDLASFVPIIGDFDSANDSKIAILGQAIPMAASRQSAATYLMENEPWDFMAVHFPSIDEITRAFIEFYPPRLPHLTDEPFEKFRGVIAEAYRFHDKMLGRLTELAGSDCTVVVCSTSGVYTGRSRAVADASKKINYNAHYRPNGVLFMSGPDVRQDELLYGATIYDLVPTILALLGAPVPQHLPGRFLSEAFSKAIPITFARVPDSPIKRPPIRYKAKRFEDGSPTPALMADLTNDLSLARCLQASGRHDLALPLLERVNREHPTRVAPVLQLIEGYRALGRTAEAVALLENFSITLEDDQEPWPAGFLPNFDLMRALLALDRNDAKTALVHLREAEKANPQLPGMHVHLGQVYSRLRRHDKAEEAFRRALEIDEAQPEAAAGLSIALYRQHRYPEAADYALLAASHAPWVGVYHLQLGRCLARLRQDDEALIAIRNALRRQPALIEAHRLAIVMQRRNNDETGVAGHRDAIQQLLPVRRHAWKLLKKLGKPNAC
jgi:predicted AlkP superfamily phosphohydrolase/phosphomutase/tetratricopeptide (TPR) repeat protein